MKRKTRTSDRMMLNLVLTFRLANQDIRASGRNFSQVYPSPQAPQGVETEKRRPVNGFEADSPDVLPGDLPLVVAVEDMEDPQALKLHRRERPEGYVDDLPSQPGGKPPEDAPGGTGGDIDHML